MIEQELDDYHREKLEAPKQYVPQQYVATTESKEERLDASELLPGYMQKLTGGYEFRQAH